MSDNQAPPPPPEPPLTKPEKLDEYEIAGLKSILIKTVAADDRMALMTKQLELLNANLATERLNRAKGVNALSIYGFDPSQSKVFTAVREVIGDKEYNEGIAIAKGTFVPPTKDDPSKDLGLVEKTESSFDESTEGDSHKSASISPKLGDAILAFMRDRGSLGAKASDVKEHLAKAYGIQTHEKTPGMTLYRLLKSGKVRREGREWFFVDTNTSGSTEDPGDKTPGQVNPDVEEETTE